MPIDKAKKHFLGKDGHERLNCAEALLKAFSELSPSDQKALCQGGGRSPNGECGAICAAKHILKKHHPEKITALENDFKEAAGSLQCQEIRKLRKLSCLGCVEKAAELLHKEVK